MTESTSGTLLSPSYEQPDSPAIRILSNTQWFTGRTLNGRPIVADELAGKRRSQTLRALLRPQNLHAVVLNGASRTLMLLCLLRRLLGADRWQLISIDLILSAPRSLRERAKAVLMRRLLRAVDLFIVYFKDTAAVEKAYGIDPRRIRYVPFKINDYHQVRSTPTTDEGYVLACGRSNRDYGTLYRAVADLTTPVVVLCQDNADLERHGTELRSEGLPEHVTLVTDDGTSDSWISWISRARCVVIPVLPDVLSPAGVGTYLVAMALGKCVIVTEGLATRGVLSQDMAVIVPPKDPAALRDAIRRVLGDRGFRERVARAGQRYALALKDVDRLADDVIDCVAPTITEQWDRRNNARSEWAPAAIDRRGRGERRGVE